MTPRQPTLGRLAAGSWGRPPRDVLLLMAALFVTWVMRYFNATAWLPTLLSLAPLDVNPIPWQLATYWFVGGPGYWILFEILILYFFARDVRAGLGRKHFWTLLLIAAVAAGAVALPIQTLVRAHDPLAAALPPWAFLSVLQGAGVLISTLVAAFATANRRATIMMMFVLPIEARHFLWIEIVLVFCAALPTHDAGSVAGTCIAVGIAYLYVQSGGRLGRGLRNTWKRLEVWWLAKRLERLRRRRGLRVVRGPGGSGGSGGSGSSGGTSSGSGSGSGSSGPRGPRGPRDGDFRVH
jgi:membrane associated rhomboid family serine protease